jgi:Der1-like family
MGRLKMSPNLVFVGLILVAFIAGFVFPDPEFWFKIAFAPAKFASQPWSILTYPFAFAQQMGPFALLFMAVWLFSVGGQVENDLGQPKYVGILVLFTVLPAIFMAMGTLIVGQSGMLAGPFALVAALTVMWATRNPLATVMIFGLVPVQARWIGVASAATIFFGTSPALAPFAGIPMILAWAFAANKLPLQYAKPRSDRPTERYRKHPKEDDNYFADVKRREKEREERERLRKLFEGSLKDEDK